MRQETRALIEAMQWMMKDVDMSGTPNNGEDIPDDVWTKAGNEAMRYVEWLIPKPLEYAAAEYVLTVSFARAILAERERAASVILSHIAGLSGQDAMLRAIAHEITEGKPAQA